MNEANEIKNRLRELADSGPRQPGADSEERLLSAFRAHHRRHKSRRTYIAQAAGLMIVGLTLYFAFAQRVNHPAHATDTQSSSIKGSQNGESEILPGFVALPYAQSGVPLGEAVVMRVQLAPSDFKLLGVSAPPGANRQRVGADVLIGQDGLARAVRFLP